METLEAQFNMITAKYLTSGDFPTRKSCAHMAETFRNDFLLSRHPSGATSLKISTESEMVSHAQST